jgi:Flp pilus assembly protein TadD
VLLRTAEFRSIYQTNAASRLAAHAVRKKKYLEAAQYSRRTCINLALGRGAFIDATAYLRVPAGAHLHQARGLAAAGKLDAAIAEVKMVLEYLPEEISSVIDLVRAFDRAKRKEGQKLLDDMLVRLQKACADYPKDAGCHNRLAWLLVRCGRRLDTALKHARTATTLMPDSPGFLDTLAEVHFQRGDKAEALAAIKRAVKLAPKQPLFARQMKRIEAGDRNAELPEP